MGGVHIIKFDFIAHNKKRFEKRQVAVTSRSEKFRQEDAIENLQLLSWCFGKGMANAPIDKNQVPHPDWIVMTVTAMGSATSKDKKEFIGVMAVFGVIGLPVPGDVEGKIRFHPLPGSERVGKEIELRR